MVAEGLLDKLCCPVCKGALALAADSPALTCGCGQRYPVSHDIPVFLVGKDETAYDHLYDQIDFEHSPFGYSPEYAEWRKMNINREIAKHLKPGTVLDDGGGYGFLKQALDPQKHHYYNMDCSYAILKYDDSAFRCIGEGEALPFKDNTFDNVVSGDVLEHVREKGKYLSETYRVLKPGGVFVVNTPRTKWIESYLWSVWFWIFCAYSIHGKLSSWFSRKKPKLTVPEGVVDIPSDEAWLGAELGRVGYHVVAQTRTDNHLFGFTGPFWRRFADSHIDARKYGHCVLFACTK